MVAWACGSLTAPRGVVAAEPIELRPDSQYARLGYIEFGRAVAARADVVLAASRPDDPLSLNYEGGNWVDAFRGNGFEWVNEAGLVAIGGDTSNRDIYDSDDFGAALALSTTGQTAFVGAPDHDGQGRDSGAVFVFRPLNRSWYQAGELYFPGQPYQHFGSAIAAGGDPLRIAVGASGSVDEGRAPAVYIYKVCFGFVPPFCLTDSLAPPVESARDFGVAVATDGAWLAVGSMWDTDPPNQLYGAVYLYKFENELARWVLRQTLRPNPAAGNGFFGTRLAIGGPGSAFLAVGAPAENTAGRRDGSVYVFERQDDQWTLLQRLTPPPPGQPSSSLLGESLGFSESVLAIGSGWAPATTEHHGSVHAYRLDGQRWIRAATFWLSDDEGDYDQLGWSVAAAGETIVAGAPGSSSLELKGAVFVGAVPPLGDANGDGDVDLADAALLISCLDGPGGTGGLRDCVPSDYDADGDVDLADAAVMLRAIR